MPRYYYRPCFSSFNQGVQTVFQLLCCFGHLRKATCRRSLTPRKIILSVDDIDEIVVVFVQSARRNAVCQSIMIALYK